MLLISIILFAATAPFAIRCILHTRQTLFDLTRKPEADNSGDGGL